MVHREGAMTPSFGGRNVLVTGAGGQLGRLVLRRLVASDDIGTVVAVDRELAAAPPGVDARRFDFGADPESLAAAAAGVDVLIHLAWRQPDPDGDDPNRPLLDAVLDACAAADVAHLVVISSATVYGAWPHAPLPISEVEVLRPNPGFRYAEVKAEHERRIVRWRRERSTSVSVLRPAAAVADGQMSWLGQSLMDAVALRAGIDDPPVQFLHVDDLASAVVVAAAQQLDGPYNVAPDGWLAGADMRALLGPRPRLRLPVSVAERVEDWLASTPRSPRPAGLLPYTMHSWVVSNDRLRSVGWTPGSQNDEAFVEADQAPPWVALNARQRQYLSLGVLGAVIVGIVVGVIVAVVRRRR